MSDSSIELKIDGMTCSHCERGVKQAIGDVQGVDRVDVDLQRGTAIVHGTADAPAVLSAVQEEGYTARIISSHHHHG
jgi:copper chaperone CopZ